MACTIGLYKPIFSIHHITSPNEKLYIFVGNLDTNTKKIINKINFGISKEEKNILQKNVPIELINLWTKRKDDGVDIILLDEILNYDDTISTLKKKIYVYLSDPKNNIYYPENNQQLWIENETSNKTKMLGYTYFYNDEKIEIEPSPYLNKSQEIDERFIGAFSDSINDKIKIKNDKYSVLFDEININNAEESEIFFYDLFQEKIDFNNEKLKYGFIMKYWPDYQIKDINNFENYKKIKMLLEKDKKIIQFVDSFKINESNFTNCNIYHTLFHINEKENEEYVDLLKIFNFIRENLSIEIPFVKYKDIEWNRPFIAVYDEIINKKYVDVKTLTDWIYFRKKDNVTGQITFKEVTRGLTFKLLSYKINDIPKYSTVNIYRTGKIDFTISFVDEHKANINDIEHNLDILIKLLKKINEINYDVDKEKDRKIKIPFFKLVGNKVNRSENLKIIFMSTISKINFNKSIEYQKLLELANIFTPYLSVSEDESQKNRLNFIYKRVSNFKNMTEIFKFISEQLSAGRFENDIIIDILLKFDKTKKEAIEIYNQFKSRFDTEVIKQPGITLSINNNTNNLQVTGSPSFYQLMSANKFIYVFLSIYFNFDIIKKQDTFKEILKLANIKSIQELEDQEEKLEPLDLSVLDKNKNINLNMNALVNIDEFDYGSNLNKYLEEVETINNDQNNQNNKQNQNDENDKNDEDNQKKNILKDLASNEEIDLNIRLKCNDAVPELDTCKDLCNDRSYFLRRLQRHDPKLFNYPTHNKTYRKYSIYCQAVNQVQPVAMRTDPTKNPKIDRKSFTYAIKYGSSPDKQNYYICPKVWCPVCEIPILLSKVTDIKKKVIQDGNCIVGKCPNGDHQVFINTKYLWEKKQFDESGLYPGFTSAKHPDGFCLPCCYGKPQNIPESSSHITFKKCLGEQTNDEEDIENNFYILSATHTVGKGRYGLLSPIIQKLFGTPGVGGPLSDPQYLRKGIKVNDKHSFYEAILDIVSNEDKNINLELLKKHISSKLTEELFITLNEGSLKLLFGNVENYKSYIFSDEFVSHKYVADLFSRNGILYDYGINIVILDNKNILCPFSVNSKDHYDKNKQFIFFYKMGKYYEPIYYLKPDNKIVLYDWKFSYNKSPINYIYNLIIKNCQENPGIDWNKILQDNNKKYGIDLNLNLEPEINLNTTIETKNINIDKLVIDYYNKVVAILDKNGTYIPVKPSGIILGYELINENNVNYLDYKTTKNNLKKLDIEIQNKILSRSDPNKIIAIILKTGRIVPIKKSENINDNIIAKDVSFYQKADQYIHEGIDSKVEDDRIEIVAKMEFENESYERLRFEIANYLSLTNNAKIKNTIREIIKSNQITDLKRKELFVILTDIYNLLVSDKHVKIDFSKYQTPNIRTICSKNIDCLDDQHCVFVNGKCKLYISEYNLITNTKNKITYLTMLTDEIIRNKIKSDEILNNNVREIIDKSKIVQKNDQTIFSGPYEMVIKDIEKMYKKENKIKISDRKIFSIAEPTFEGIEKDKLERYSYLEDIDEIINLELLSTHWEKILGNDFKAYQVSPISSLFNSLTRIYNSINQDNRITTNLLKQKLIDYSPSEDIIYDIADNLDVDKNKLKSDNELLLQLYKTFDPSYYKDINSLSNLYNYIQSKNYEARMVDIYLLSYILNMNIFVLDKRSRKSEDSLYKFIRQKSSNDYILLYYQIIKDNLVYYAVQNNGKFVFSPSDFPDRFREGILNCEIKKIEK